MAAAGVGRTAPSCSISSDLGTPVSQQLAVELYGFASRRLSAASTFCWWTRCELSAGSSRRLRGQAQHNKDERTPGCCRMMAMARCVSASQGPSNRSESAPSHGRKGTVSVARMDCGTMAAPAWPRGLQSQS